MVVIHFGYDDEDNERRRWWHVGVQVARSPHSGSESVEFVRIRRGGLTCPDYRVYLHVPSNFTSLLSASIIAICERARTRLCGMPLGRGVGAFTVFATDNCHAYTLTSFRPIQKTSHPERE